MFLHRRVAPADADVGADADAAAADDAISVSALVAPEPVDSNVLHLLHWN